MNIVALEDRRETWNDFIARIAGGLSELERRGDAASWEKARLVVDGWLEAKNHSQMHNLTERQRSKRFYDDLRAWWAENDQPVCRASFMANARKLYATWPEVVSFETNILPYQHYRQMAVCGLPRDQKNELRAWAEEHRPKQTELRQEIRHRVDALDGVYKPDFELKTSNHWIFQVEGLKRSDGFDGGVNAALYANLIHSFSDPGDTILDPFAGGGLLANVLTGYRHFRETTLAEHSGPRHALMSDVAPTRADILQGDARDTIPVETEAADLAILDPPYFEVSNGKYAGLGTNIREWMSGLQAVLEEVARCLRPDGVVAIMTDDVVRKQIHEPMGFRVYGLLKTQRWRPLTTIYNFNRNYTAMSGSEMARAKTYRLHVNAVKIIQVARRPQAAV